jgi:hypothetical protein
MNDLDIFDHSKKILYGILIYLIMMLIWNIVRFKRLYILSYLISIIVLSVIIYNFDDSIEENESKLCLAFIKTIDEFNSKYTHNDGDSGDDGDAPLFTRDDIKGIERIYACGCNESKGVYLRPKNRPENKKGSWKNSSGEIEEKTYMEEYGEICNDTNKCKVEDRPLKRCVDDNSCLYPGMVCYKHPSFSTPMDEGGRTTASSDLKGVCILQSNIHNLEEIIDTYNESYCDPLEDGSIDYNCSSPWDTRPGHDFLNTERDILSNISGRGLGANDDISICYHPSKEKVNVSGFDDETLKYIRGPGSECCVPKEEKGNHQSDSLLESLIKNPGELMDILMETIFYELMEQCAVRGLTKLIQKRREILSGLKKAGSVTSKMLEGIRDLMRAENKAAELSIILKNLLGKFKDGLKAMNDMRKVAVANAKASTRRALERQLASAGTRAAENMGETVAGEALAAGAEAAGEKALAKVGEKAAEKTAKKMSQRLLNLVPGVGQILAAVQMIGLVMDETGYGGYENIFKNREIIETMSEQTEGLMIKAMKLQDKEPPYCVDLPNTFFGDENHNEGSSWPFNMDEVQSSDKEDCQLLVDIIRHLKEEGDNIMVDMLAEQLQTFTDSFQDEETSNTIMSELEGFADRTDSRVENDLGDYFTEYIASYTHYHYTKQEAEERDQKTYDAVLSKTNLADDSRYKSVTNTGVYYNDDALIYLNKELSSEEYSGILLTKKAVDLYNRYRNLREGQQYIVFSKYYYDIAYIESNSDYPNNEKLHLKKLELRNSKLFSDSRYNLSRNNPIFTKGMSQVTQMNDLVNVCQYGIKLGVANYSGPGINGMVRAMDGLGVNGDSLGNTWLKGGSNPVNEQPFGYPELNGNLSCRDGCKENYMADDASDEEAKMRLENYNNRIMSWNYADKSEWKNSNDDQKSSALIAVFNNISNPHDEVVDHDNRICKINSNYCDRAGNLDGKWNIPFGGGHSNTLNYFDQKYGNNHRIYNDCEASGVHEAFSAVFGESMTSTVARWFT